MTSPKLLTEADVKRLTGSATWDEVLGELRERGLIKLEPVDPLEAEAFAIVQEQYPDVRRDYNGRRFLIALAALRRGMELAERPTLTREMFDAAHKTANQRWNLSGYRDGFADYFHAALSEQLK